MILKVNKYPTRFYYNKKSIFSRVSQSGIALLGKPHPYFALEAWHLYWNLNFMLDLDSFHFNFPMARTILLLVSLHHHLASSIVRLMTHPCSGILSVSNVFWELSVILATPMLVTKCVGDNFDMLVDLRHQHRNSVTNIQKLSSTSQYHQDYCSCGFWKNLFALWLIDYESYESFRTNYRCLCRFFSPAETSVGQPENRTDENRTKMFIFK